MLSIEEIKLLIEKLERVKKEDLQKLIDSNLKILKDLAVAVDANNEEEINRLDKTVEWFNLDLEQKRNKPVVDLMLYKTIQTKIFQFAKSFRIFKLELINFCRSSFSTRSNFSINNFISSILSIILFRIQIAC